MYPIDDEKCLLFPEPQPLVKRLLSFIEAVRKPNGSSGAQYGQKLTCNSFAVLVEASLRDHQFWATVKESVNVDELIQSLLLEQPHQASRNDVAERIKKACGSTKSLKGLPESKNDDEMPNSVSYTERSSHIDMLATIWQSLIKIIPKSLDYATQSAELFTVCLSMFLSVTRSSTCDVTLNEYVNEWSNVLFERLAVRTEEVSKLTVSPFPVLL